MKIMVKHCARCNNDHEMEFVQFQHFGIGDCNYWGMCPYINEPVIMKIVEVEEDEIILAKDVAQMKKKLVNWRGS